MLGLVLKVLFTAAAAAAVASIIITVQGIINRTKIRNVLASKGVEQALLKEINECDNTVTLEDMESGTKYEVRGDGIDSSLREGQKIVV